MAEGISLIIVEQDIVQALKAVRHVYCLQEGRVALAGAHHPGDRDEVAVSSRGVTHLDGDRPVPGTQRAQPRFVAPVGVVVGQRDRTERRALRAPTAGLHEVARRRRAGARVVERRRAGVGPATYSLWSVQTACAVPSVP